MGISIGLFYNIEPSFIHCYIFNLLISNTAEELALRVPISFMWNKCLLIHALEASKNLDCKLV